MEKLTHMADGTLVSDDPRWWLREGDIIAISNSTGVTSFGIIRGSAAIIDAECVLLNQGRNRLSTFCLKPYRGGKLIQGIKEAFRPIG